MSARTRVRFLLVLAAVTAVLSLHAGAQQVATSPAQAQAQAQAQALALTQAMPVDPQITTGRFSNGLRYYLRTNKLPEKRAELRLAVNAGSVLEDDDQLGLAQHARAHGLQRDGALPEAGDRQFMESIGMRFGPSLNAFTSFDETVYMLTVPTDKPESWRRPFSSWRTGPTTCRFDPVEIDKERGVIVEEWRLGRGAAARMRDVQFPRALQGGRATPSACPSEEGVDRDLHARLAEALLQGWYRPDLMAVVAVGDFDKAAVEGLLKKHFESLPAVKVPRLRPTYSVPDNPGTLYTSPPTRKRR